MAWSIAGDETMQEPSDALDSAPLEWDGVSALAQDASRLRFVVDVATE